MAVALIPGWLPAQTVAITGAKIYPVSGPAIENGTIVLQDGRIAAIGTNITVPAGAVRVDGSGKIVTPGLFHAGSNLGLSQVGSINETNENNHEGNVNPSFNVLEGIDPTTALIPIARLEGVTTALSRPDGGLVAGQGVIIDLAGNKIETMLVRSPAVMVINFGAEAKDAGGGSRAGVLAALRKLFTDALEYERRKSDFNRNQIQPLAAPAAELEALLPVLKGELPVVAVANRQSDILSALRIASEYKLRMILAGSTEAWKVADDLARAKVPVIVNPIFNIPSFDGLGARFDNPGLLAKAGVTVIVVEGETGGARNLRWAAGHAVRFGMTWDQALAAITLEPAKAFRVDDRYGSLAVGKVANVVLWSGDPLDFNSKAEKVYIRGVEQPHTSRQTELYQRYKTLPPAY
ncbi:MAG TPA: amidohydrolase family protein [Gemmatimonadales bacterium]|nr:amidohydrolase family protein [Gemmatimonadales bacterium]